MKIWLSCSKFTVMVVTDQRGVITNAAPIAARFIGQPITALRRWMRGFGKVWEERL